MMDKEPPQILTIPQFLLQARGAGDRNSGEYSSARFSMEQEDSSDPEQTDTDLHNESNQGEDGAGESEDGKSNKLTLSILLSEGLIEPGDGVLSIDYLGQSFRGDLLPIGKIRSVETGLVFNNPSAWAIYCKKIINPAKKSGCGWASIKYKGRKMDYFKNIWLKRRSQREAETAKNEAAQALTALSNSLAGHSVPSPAGQLDIIPVHGVPHPLQPGGQHSHPLQPGGVQPGPQPSHLHNQHQSDSEVQILDPPVHQLEEATNKQIIKHNQIPQAISQPKEFHVELETFLMDGKIQPFTVSVSTSAILVLDLHSHLADEDVCGYLAGQWDMNSHNLAITSCFPCLLDKDMTGTEDAQRVESEIYDKLYGNHLTLVGWYHSSPRGPSIPTVKDCLDQLDFQIKLLGNGVETYTPCVGLICSPYEASAKTVDSSIVVYWIYPPSEHNPQDYGMPMRMSYSAITDPCLSQEVLQQIDKVIDFYREKPSAVPYLENYTADLRFIDKIAKSISSKFPQDQDENLWNYIRTQLIGDEPDKPIHPSNPSSIPAAINGRKQSEEEEIDDDEESALKEENDQEEIDDDEDNAIAEHIEAQVRNYSNALGRNYSPLSFSQVISTSPPRVGNNGELDLRISGGATAQTITMYSGHQDHGVNKSKLKSGSDDSGDRIHDLSLKSSTSPLNLAPSTAHSRPGAKHQPSSFSSNPATVSYSSAQPSSLLTIPFSSSANLFSGTQLISSSVPYSSRSITTVPYSPQRHNAQDNIENGSALNFSKKKHDRINEDENTKEDNESDEDDDKLVIKE